MVCTGRFFIYDVDSGERIKDIKFPSGGEIYTFDNYPNDIYYAKNLYTQPEIYNLTKLRLTSITPGLSLPYTSGIEITLQGGLFTSSSQVYFNNQLRTTTYLTDTTLSVQLNAGDLSVVSNYPIWVDNCGSKSDTLMYSVVDALPQQIIPIVECVTNNGGGAYTAQFGYKNDNTQSVFVPIGTNNKFSPSPEDRGQSTVFFPGTNNNVFTVNFDGRNLTWNIFKKKATASKNSTPCP
ncbi:MAG: IPT/TIG domain-containing protein [Ignavibacteriaceae bacterium]